jgi:hypothetical protein
MSFSIGDRVGMVRDTFRYGTYSRGIGTVSDVTAAGRVIITWDGSPRPDDYTLDPQDLILESELKEKLSVLETDFRQVQEKVSEKVKIATDAIAEAQVLARTIRLNLRDVNEDLIDAIGQAGWNVSSLSC